MIETLPVQLRITAALLVWWVIIVWLSALIYVVMSYAESSSRLPKRPFPQTMRWILREVWLAAWTQPLLPVFQLLGLRMGTGGGDVPVVFVHGYFQNRVDFIYLASRLRKAGCGPLYAVNFFWPQRLENSSAHVRRFVEQVCRVTGAPRVDLVTHSTGGLFALDLIAEAPELVRRVAVVAIPAQGVPWRGPVLGPSGSQLRVGSLYQSSRSKQVADCTPVISVYSAHDNLVHPVCTSELEGECVRNVRIEGPGHLSVLFDRRTGDEIAGFLSAP